jgi:hypothetical protein
VSGGRTGNALNDYNANKTIATPDWRGRAMVALDDMGNVPAGRLTAAGYGAAGTTLGLPGGGETQTLTLAQLPTGISSSPSSPWTVGDSRGLNIPGYRRQRFART